MESGSNKSLFTLIAVVVFGIFLSLSYWLFQDNLKGVLADVMNSTSEMTSKKLAYNGSYPTDEKYFTVTNTGNGTCKIVSFDVSGGTDVIIPNTINGLTVTSLGNNSFAHKGLTSVVIPETVTQIDNGYWSITESYGAFSYNNLKSLIIPASVTSIGGQAFLFAGDLGDRLVIGQNVKVIGVDSFIGNKITKLYIPPNVEVISWHAFGENLIEDIKFDGNSKLIKIDNAAFTTNRIKTLTLPKSLQTVSTGAFTSNPLQSVTVNSGVIQNGVLANAFHWTNYGFDSYYDTSIIHYY